MSHDKDVKSRRKKNRNLKDRHTNYTIENQKQDILESIIPSDWIQEEDPKTRNKNGGDI